MSIQSLYYEVQGWAAGAGLNCPNMQSDINNFNQAVANAMVMGGSSESGLRTAFNEMKRRCNAEKAQRDIQKELSPEDKKKADKYIDNDVSPYVPTRTDKDPGATSLQDPPPMGPPPPTSVKKSGFGLWGVLAIGVGAYLLTRKKGK